MRRAAKTRSNSPHRLRASAVAAVAALALALPAAASAGGTALPGQGSLFFARASAKLAGDSALVPVRCAGTAEALCSGTISLSVHGHRTESPFSVTSGGERTVAVPVAGGDLAGARAVAVAKTSQVAGGFAEATEVLRLR
jgi:hypothetical protein